MPDCGTAYVNYSKPSTHINLLHSTLILLLEAIISVLFVAKYIHSSQCVLHDDDVTIRCCTIRPITRAA